ncbi:LysR family transcriptional regulator protein [Azotobacter chroococcum NCIMB 8003]|uniref:LysR family transcriptional regulator protein n=1 Tax=Azotobacter chroococcum NCIMB 8003 TaxID=1328314 RepID=A0A0C4WMI3_9GAMM|nr:LysR family transcriptional regulator protein [Azotobacter chroococcum NCIMB 8003]
MPAFTRSDLADLNVFMTIVRRRSFRQAALELGVTTSALSHSMKNLELRLGVKLLNRTSRSVVPSLAGSALAERLEQGAAPAARRHPGTCCSIRACASVWATTRRTSGSWATGRKPFTWTSPGRSAPTRPIPCWRLRSTAWAWPTAWS